MNRFGEKILRLNEPLQLHIYTYTFLSIRIFFFFFFANEMNPG